MALPAASHSRDLTDEQRVLIGPFLPKLTRRKDGRGRPPVSGEPRRTQWDPVDLTDRRLVGGLAGRYPSSQTCHRRFQHWVRCGVSVLAEALRDDGQLDVRETVIDREDGTAVCVAAELSTHVVRYERYPENFLGMLHLACSLILLRVSMG